MWNYTIQHASREMLIVAVVLCMLKKFVGPQTPSHIDLPEAVQERCGALGDVLAETFIHSQMI